MTEVIQTSPRHELRSCIFHLSAVSSPRHNVGACISMDQIIVLLFQWRTQSISSKACQLDTRKMPLCVGAHGIGLDLIVYGRRASDIDALRA